MNRYFVAQTLINWAYKARAPGRLIGRSPLPQTERILSAMHTKHGEKARSSAPNLKFRALKANFFGST
jgi:hypothetical protein